MFVGEVTGSKHPQVHEEYDPGPSKEGTGPKKITVEGGEIYFKVTEVFKGRPAGDRVTVYSTLGGGDCGQTFERGKKYVIFASSEGTPKDPSDSFFRYRMESLKLRPDPSRLWTSICSGNRELEAADTALQYLRNPPATGTGGTIEGKIFDSVRDYSSENLSMKPLANARVLAVPLDTASASVVGISDTDGNYRVRVPAGRYELRAEVPSEMKSSSYDGDDEPISVEDTKCAVRLLVVSNNSGISGKVIGAGEEEVSNLSLHLLDAAFQERIPRAKRWAFVPDGGIFKFEGVPYGEYKLCLNCTDKPDEEAPYPRWYYPGTTDPAAATIFKVGAGTRTGDLIFRLPPKLTKVAFSGTVVWKDGKPAAGAEVQLVDLDADKDVFFRELIADQDGKFKAVWFAGRRYRLKVIVWEKSKDGSGFGIADAETEEFVLQKDMPAFKIVLDTIDPRKRSTTRRTVRAK